MKKNKKSWLIVGAVVVVATIAALGLSTFLDRPKDLGPELEYISKDYSSGCFLFYCDSPASTTYVYATNLSIEQLKTYFKKAINTTAQKQEYPAVIKGEEHVQLEFELNDNERQGFTLYVYEDKTAITKSRGLKTTTSPRIILLNSQAYETAKNAL